MQALSQTLHSCHCVLHRRRCPDLRWSPKVNLRGTFCYRIRHRFVEYGCTALQCRGRMSPARIPSSNTLAARSSGSSWKPCRITTTCDHIRDHGLLLDRLWYKLHRRQRLTSEGSSMAHTFSTSGRPRLLDWFSLNSLYFSLSRLWFSVSGFCSCRSLLGECGFYPLG